MAPENLVISENTALKMTARSNLAQRLVQEGLLSAAAVATAQQEALTQRLPFTVYLTKLPGLNKDMLAWLIAAELGWSYLSLAAVDVLSLPQGLIATSLLQDKQLLLAMANPSSLAAVDELRFQSGLKPVPVIVAQDQLEAMLAKFLAATTGQLEALQATELHDLASELQHESNNTSGASGSAGADQQDDEPVVKFVNQVLQEAVRRGASDVHFEPFEHSYRIRCRIDGVLQELAQPALTLSSRLAARIKVMAQMDISERRLPQDGSMKLNLGTSTGLDFRVNTLPTLGGEKVVVRILDAATTQLELTALGMEPEQYQIYAQALERPQGMLLVTGPTGSGKTVTLYAGLSRLNTSERNICSVEDPVEIYLEGVNQVNINPKIGLDFATVLRAFLRQDPDVVMLGEIRDLESAAIAVKAAQTGHLVLATLHTNSAVATLNRLINMGVASYNLAASLQLVIAQRLVRKLCQHCRTPDTTAPDILQELGFSTLEVASATMYKPVGCSECTLGYKGRVGIYELVKLTPALATLLMQGASVQQLEQQARQEGYMDLRTAGRRKVIAGLTSVAELSRLTWD